MNERNELTPEAEQELSSLINASYPSPSGKMADRVKEKISAIRAAKKKRQTLIMRYGSIAACIVLIAGIALAVVPRIAGGKSAVITEDNAVTEEKMMAYHMASQTECESLSDGANEMPCYVYNESDTPEETADYALDMLKCSADLDPENHPTSNGSKFFEECGDEEVVTVPEPSFAGRNDGLIPNLAADDAAASPSALIDIDGDGESEYCEVTYVYDPGFAIRITASVGGETKSESVFPFSPCSVSFEKTDGQILIRKKDNATENVTYYAIAVDGNEIVLKPIK